MDPSDDLELLRWWGELGIDSVSPDVVVFSLGGGVPEDPTPNDWRSHF